MRLNWKQIGVIILFILAIGLFAFFLYYFFWRTLFLPPEPITNEIIDPDRLPAATVNINGRTFLVDTEGRLISEVNANLALPDELIVIPPEEKTPITPLTNETALFATVGPDGQIIYYNPNTGKFYRVSSNGVVTAYHNQTFHNVSNVTWSNNRAGAILEYPDGMKIFYNFNKSQQVTLPKHWQEFDFSPNDQQIIFKNMALDPENRFLIVARPDGSQAQIIEPIGGVENQFQVNWSPNNQMVATFTQGRDLNRSEVYFVGLNNENFQLMVVDGRGFQGQWSPDGQRILYSVYNSRNDYKPRLWLSSAGADTIGENRQSLELATWADKCAFASAERIVCAVPIYLPVGAGLDPRVARDIPDQIYEINLRTGTKTLLALPEGDHTINQIIITDDQKYLFFTSLKDNKIYRLPLMGN